jgi:hypothetical protein
MQEKIISRRQMLRSVAALGVAGAVNIEGFRQVAVAQSKSKTPPHTQSEMTAIETALPPFIVVANNFAGADMGAKINAANAALDALGTIRGEIWVYGGGSIATPVTVSHNLKLFDGVYTCDTPFNEVPFNLKDNVTLSGTSWNTVIVEPSYLANGGYAAYKIVSPFANTIRGGPYGETGGSPSKNIHIHTLHFKGLRTNPQDGGSTAGIFWGNCDNHSVRNCWFDEISGYCSNFGGALGWGFHPKNGYFEGNLCTNIFTQNVAVVDGQNIFVRGNIFANPGKRPFKIVSATNANPVVITTDEDNYAGLTFMNVLIRNALGNTAINGEFICTRISDNSFSIPVAGNGVYTANSAEVIPKVTQGAVIDIEPNADSEKIHNIFITDNIIDLTDASMIVNGIGASIANVAPTEVGAENSLIRISGNTLRGVKTGMGTAVTAVASFYLGSRDFIIQDNHADAWSVGLYLSGKRFLVSGNKLTDCGQAGAGMMSLFHLSDSVIENNVLQNILYETAADIWEFGVCRKNKILNNVVHRIRHYAGANFASTYNLYKGNVMLGAGSGIEESAGSDYNIFDDNLSEAGAAALVKVGTNSKMVSHKYTDGRVFVNQAMIIGLPVA